MEIGKCWIAYFLYYATGEGMHYALAIANSPERATQLFVERSGDLFQWHSTTALLSETLEKYPGMRAVIPEEVYRRTSDPMCWTLEYFATVDFNCA